MKVTAGSHWVFQPHGRQKLRNLETIRADFDAGLTCSIPCYGRRPVKNDFVKARSFKRMIGARSLDLLGRLAGRGASLVPEQSKQDDDRDWNAQ